MIQTRDPIPIWLNLCSQEFLKVNNELKILFVEILPCIIIIIIITENCQILRTLLSYLKVYSYP